MATMSFVKTLAYRVAGEAKKRYLAHPSWADVLQCFHGIEAGEISYLDLMGPEEVLTHMAVLAKPGHYHMAIFSDEDDVCIFQASVFNDEKIDIEGDYWPQYQICTQFEDAVSAVHHFFIHGEPSAAFDWVCISEEE